MDISIIIGLLIALVIICATTVVNNIILKDYLSLKKKWGEKTKLISDIIHDMGKIEECVSEIRSNTGGINSDMERLSNIASSISNMVRNMRNYEYDNF